MPTRQNVVDTARTFLKVPFTHLGRHAQRGVDCVGLVLMVGEKLGLVDAKGVPFTANDYPVYPREPEPGRVLVECNARMKRKLASNLLPGDVVCMRFPIEATHTAIITRMDDGNLGVIHAYNGGNFEVIEHLLDNAWRRRIVAAFEIPGVE